MIIFSDQKFLKKNERTLRLFGKKVVAKEDFCLQDRGCSRMNNTARRNAS